MSLAFVGHRCCDHSPSSGYDQVCALFPDAGWLSGPELTAGRLTWFREPSTPPQVFHVFYGDCSGSGLPPILRERFPGAAIVSTVHQPVSRLVHDTAGLASLHGVDVIITVSKVQARQLADLDLTASVHVIPHGVWTHVFRPPPEPDAGRRDSVLLVGNYLRDWDGMQRAVEALARAGVRSRVIGSAAPDRLSAVDPLVEITPRIAEAELVSLYDRSAALLLPVLDATASNAVLEAMAVGCPVVCPRLPSLVEEYLGDDVDAFEPGRYDLAVDRLLTYVREPARRAARSRVLVERAKQFDWSRLRGLFEAVYGEAAHRDVAAQRV